MTDPVPSHSRGFWEEYLDMTDPVPMCPGEFPAGVPADAGQRGRGAGLVPQCSATREAQVHGAAGAAPCYW